MKKTCFFIFLLFNVSCGSGSLPFVGGTGQNECNFRVHRGFVVKWENLPIPVYIDSSVSQLTQENIYYSIDMWNSAWNYKTGRGRLFELIGKAHVDYLPNDKAANDDTNIVFLDRKYRLLSSHQQGVTNVRSDLIRGIHDGDIIFNNVDFRFFYEQEAIDYSAYTKVPKFAEHRRLASSSPASFMTNFFNSIKSFLRFFAFWLEKPSPRDPSRKKQIPQSQLDFISLALHELGHLAALVHIDNVPSIMNSTLRKGQIRRNIGDIELNSLSCEYKN